MTLPRLGINLDHIVSLREARHTLYPDFRKAIETAEAAGADGITIHLREDRRHIQDRDVYLAREVVSTTLNLEMAATDEMIRIACDVKPNFCCIVPERREELTTEGGLDVIRYQNRLRDLCSQLAEMQIKVSLFIEPDPAVIDTVAAIGAPMVELHTGKYADLQADTDTEYERLVKVARYAADCGLIVNAGHGLSISNVGPIAAISQIYELNIGHAIVADAIFMGLDNAVREMKQTIRNAVQ